MRLLLLIFEKLWWPTRKIFLYRKGGVVLYLGTDVYPPPRADIILIPHNEQMTPFVERCKKTFKFILHCNCNNIPLNDNSVDFIILSSALEFCSKPAELLSELSRIGKAGYVESASAILDRFYPHPSRVSEVLECENSLLIKNKIAQVEDEFLSSARLFQTNNHWSFIFKFFPHFFMISYRWENKIEYNYFKSKGSQKKSHEQVWSINFSKEDNLKQENTSIKNLIKKKLNSYYSKKRLGRINQLKLNTEMDNLNKNNFMKNFESHNS